MKNIIPLSEVKTYSISKLRISYCVKMDIKKRIKNALFLFLLSIPALSQAQQDAIYSQYMYNPFAINPAYAGTRNSMSAVILHRSQWVGIDGAPVTQTASLHAPVNKYKIAWGVNFGHDKLGPTRNLFGGLTGAYHLKFRESKLSFGLRAGFFNTIFNKNVLNFKEDGDMFDVGGVSSSTIPSIDFGLYYYKTKFFMGLSVNHAYSGRFNFEDLPNNSMYLRAHLMFNAGYVFEISEKFVLKPSILTKSTEVSPLNVDLNLSTMFYKKFWVGISFRNRSSVNVLLDFNITDYLRLGYAYDIMINELSQYARGTHELFIGFDFDIKKSQTISPRYL